MGLYLRYVRPGKVLECSALGFVLVMASIFAGQSVGESATLAPVFALAIQPGDDRSARLGLRGEPKGDGGPSAR